MRRALGAGLALGAAAALLGVFIVQRGLGLLSDGLAHATFGGLALGLLLGADRRPRDRGWRLPFTVAIALGIQYVRRRTTLGGDVATGVFFAVSFAAGILFLGLRPPRAAAGERGGPPLRQPARGLAGVARRDPGRGRARGRRCSLWIGPRLAYATFDPELAALSGVPVAALEYLLLALTALVVVVGVKTVGVVLVSAFVVIPAATASLLGRTLGGDRPPRRRRERRGHRLRPLRLLPPQRGDRGHDHPHPGRDVLPRPRLPAEVSGSARARRGAGAARRARGVARPRAVAARALPLPARARLAPRRPPAGAAHPAALPPLPGPELPPPRDGRLPARLRGLPRVPPAARRRRALPARPARSAAAAKRNADVVAETGPPEATEEKHEVYRRYLEARHDGQMSGSWEEFREFLHEAPPFTREVVFRVGGPAPRGGDLRRRARTPSPPSTSTSTPTSRPARPGTLNVLWLVEECRRRGVPWLYLGYHVAGSPSMAYKAGFRPHQVLSRRRPVALE